MLKRVVLFALSFFSLDAFAAASESSSSSSPSSSSSWMPVGDIVQEIATLEMIFPQGVTLPEFCVNCGLPPSATFKQLSSYLKVQMQNHPASRASYAAQLMFLANLSTPNGVSEQTRSMLWMQNLFYSLQTKALTQSDLHALLSVIDVEMRPFLEAVIDGTHEAAFKKIMAHQSHRQHAMKSPRLQRLYPMQSSPQPPSSFWLSSSSFTEERSSRDSHSRFSGLDGMSSPACSEKLAQQRHFNKLVLRREMAQRNSGIDDKTLRNLVTVCTLGANAQKIISAARKYIKAHPGIAIPTEHLEKFLRSFWNATKREMQYPAVYENDYLALFSIGLAELMVMRGAPRDQLQQCIMMSSDTSLPPELKIFVESLLLSGWEVVLQNLLQGGLCSDEILQDVAQRMIELQSHVAPSASDVPPVSSGNIV